MKRIPANALIAITAMLIPWMFTSSATAEEKGKESPAYAIAWDAGTVKIGQDGTLTLAITAGKGYKWNKQFPASFKITPSGEAAKIASTDFRKDAFKSDGKKTALKVQVKGAAAGQTMLEGKARFSVCNEESCIVKTETIRTTVQVD
jgi:hypothetical protein